MTPEFYRTVINPDAKKFKHLFAVTIEEVIRREAIVYIVYWPENSEQKARKAATEWAQLRGTRVLSMKEV